MRQKNPYRSSFLVEVLAVWLFLMAVSVVLYRQAPQMLSSQISRDVFSGWSIAPPPSYPELFVGQLGMFGSLLEDRPQIPARIIIPRIKVDAVVEAVGVTSEGAMDASKRRDVVSWFQLGARPGESGSSVMAGHYGLRNKVGSVFDNLHALRVGDVIIVEGASGSAVTFSVKESRRYSANDDAESVFGIHDGIARLNLITCEGAWDEGAQQYTKRLVVFTEKQ